MITLAFFPASTSGDLYQALRQPLRAAKIGAEQSLVSIDNDHQRKVREMVTLREHLRANEDPRLTRGGQCKCLAHGALKAGTVAVNPGNCLLRKPAT